MQKAVILSASILLLAGFNRVKLLNVLEEERVRLSNPIDRWLTTQCLAKSDYGSHFSERITTFNPT
jgi:hypothetical protein